MLMCNIMIPQTIEIMNYSTMMQVAQSNKIVIIELLEVCDESSFVGKHTYTTK
jgi:hypothetical protein